MLAIALSALLLTASPQQSPQTTETIRVLPSDRMAGSTMTRFRDNERRAWIISAHYAQRRDNRRAMAQQRQLLAERLDHMIGNGHCDRARTTAEWAGQADIQREVIRVCEARLGG